MNSSHSGTPIFSALAVAVLAGAVLLAALLALPFVAFWFVVGSDLEQPASTMAHATQRNKETLVNILTLLRFQPSLAD